MDSVYNQGSYHAGMPCGRWSLLDMMNFSLQGFALALKALSRETEIARVQTLSASGARVADDYRKRLDDSLQFVEEQCHKLNLGNARNRLERTFVALRSSSSVFTFPIYTYGSLYKDLITLKEAIEDDIKSEYFYHYPRQKAELVFKNGEWIPAFKAFPSMKSEAEEGIDCYALGHNPACVFHMMRVAELGMRALARERRVAFPKHPIEWAEWGKLIDEIETNARAATNGMTRGPALDAARAFYTAAVAQLRAFKETRNRIMHMRGGFDELDAQRAMNQVRDFMNGLSVKIGEKTKTPIRRWP